MHNLAKKMFSVIIGTIIFILTFMPSSVSALDSGDMIMSINPSGQEVDLEPGSKYLRTVKLTNAGKFAFNVKASVAPYFVGNNYEPDFEVESAYTKLHNWITLEKQEYHLEPGETVDVNFIISVPEDVASGGQYAAIMLLGDSEEKSTSPMQVQAQLAAIIYGHVMGGELHREGVLVEHDLPGFMFNSKLAVSQTVENPGNVDFKVTQTMTITNFFTNKEVINANTIDSAGQMVGTNTSVVLPGTSRTGILTWNNSPKLGLFWVKQDIAFLDQSYSYRQLVLLCPTWLFVLVMAVIIALIVLAIWYILRKRQAKKNQAKLS